MDFDRDRPPYHRTPSINSGGGGGGAAPSGELLVCFASRLSSTSSMKLSKSVLSPGRSRDPSASLSASLSRRLRSGNGSLKAGGGQASPMFPKKQQRGSAFDNPEPSSPKVTCIGQVRVKTKKKKKKKAGRSLSTRRGDLSFRKLDDIPPSLQGQRSSSAHYQECVPHRNQRWVHLPLTICEALRTFGAEFSCLFPCRSSCFSPNERGKQIGSKDCGGGGGEPSSDGQQHGSCGAVLARWLVAVQEDGEGGKGRGIELVVAGGGGDKEEEEERIGRGRPSAAMPSSRSRRHVFEDFDLNGEDGETVVVEEEKARVSVCIPPKNALLLMRCRSDPMKMAALANRFWETPADFNQNEDDDREGYEDKADDEEQEGTEPEVEVSLVVNDDERAEEFSDEDNASSVVLEEENPKNEETVMAEKDETQVHLEEDNVEEAKMETDHKQRDLDSASCDSHIDHHHQSSVENVSSEINPYQLVRKDDPISFEQEEKEEEPIPPRSSSSSQLNYNTPNQQHCEADDDDSKQEASLQEEVTGEAKFEELDEKEASKEVVEEEHGDEEENVTKLSAKEDALPECLLLMMCEPKLSMEVSKETWVCSTDFVRWMPERPTQLKARKKDTTVNKRAQCASSGAQQQDRSRQLPLQPARRRSSCSLPPRSSVSGGSMASMIEQKLVNAMAYEPFVLTRCKSEPMRTAAAKLAPEPCFWKDRKLLEPHRRATVGFGAAGVGF